jgi:beta-lactamase superfamily II metal-dependent hydrolase
MEITVFFVGHGLCIIITGGDATILYDAGGINIKEKDKVVGAIVNKIVLGGKNKLNVILSHAHKDHVNLLPSILNSKRLEEFEVRIIVGGEEKEDDDKIGIEKIHKKSVFGYTKTVDPEDFLFGLGDGIQVNYCTNDREDFDKDKDNAISIIMHVKDTVGFSAILGGDANENSFKNFEFLESNLYLITHHGSNKFHANTTSLLQKIKPNIAVVSAYLSYNHPRLETMQHVIQTSTMANAPKHKITCGVKDSNQSTFLGTTINSNQDYQTFETSKAIYTTRDTGGVSFESNQDGEVYVQFENRKQKLLDLGRKLWSFSSTSNNGMKIKLVKS